MSITVKFIKFYKKAKLIFDCLYNKLEQIDKRFINNEKMP